MPPFFKSVRKLSLLFAAATAFSAANAQKIPGLPKISTPAAVAAKAETQDELQARLQDWLKDARGSLARFEEPSAESQLPAGVQPQALADRRRDLDQTVRTINRTLSLLGDLPDAKNAVTEAEAAGTGWNSFPDKPPYSILKLDDLLNQRDATREKDATFKSSVSIFTKSLDGIDQETKISEESIRKAVDLVAKSPTDEAAKWQLEAARTKSRLLSVRALFVRTNIDLIQQQAAASAAQLALLDRQVAVVQKSATLSDADLATIQKASDDRRAGLRSESAVIRQRLKDASAARIRAKAAFDDLTATAADANSPDLGIAAAKLSATEERVDTLQFISDNLESFESLEAFIPSSYQSRKILLESKLPAERDSALQTLNSLLNRLTAWQTVSANELNAINADIAKQDSNSSTIPPDDPRLASLTDQRKSLWEKQNFVQRISQTVTAHRKNVSRWISDYETAGKGQYWYSDIHKSGTSIWDHVIKIWSMEVQRFDTVRVVAGIPYPDSRILTLGGVISALTFFVIAYLVSARFSRRLQRVVVGRGHIAEAQANTLRTWSMILVSIALALTTLKYFAIPLTVFAFFGGALAIGLGFGTQTLIKNFISGIIVLFERKIRVGDIVELDATTSGKVVEINTRSSVLRNGDGKETLVPNSLFLESRVTNLTLSNRRIRRLIRVGVSYGSSPSQVGTILKECVDRHGLVLKDPAPVVVFEDFGDNALLFVIYFWTEFNDKTDAGVVASDIRIMIEKRFAEAEIGFPFPQRDLHLKADEPLKIQVVAAEPPEAWPPKKTIP